MSFPVGLKLDDLLRSARAEKLKLPNAPTPEHLEALVALAWVIGKPVLDHFGTRSIVVTSGYRSPDLNKETPGSSVTSQHSRGEAMDIVCSGDGVTNAALFRFIAARLPFDQLIWEYGTDKEPQWVHVSYANKRKGRRVTLRCVKDKHGKPKYSQWTP